MVAPKCPEDEFILLYRSLGPDGTAKKLGCRVRTVHQRRAGIERRNGIVIVGPNAARNRPTVFPGRLETKCYDGTVFIGSDFHYWPGEPSTAHKAFIKLAKKLRPKIVIANGDVLDFGQISRHPPINWESQPSVADQIDVASVRLDELQKAAPNAERYFTLGNHDARFETKLASVAPEYAKVHGVHLKDHFPFWQPCWSVFINDSVVVKHRFKSGIHAPHNNTMWGGLTMVTGHLHSQKVYPFTDYKETRWGVDCGTMQEPYGEMFSYAEDNPRSWRSGFCVLTFAEGELLQPELCRVVREGVVDWRGELINV